MPSLSRAWCPFPAGCKFLLELVHMIGVTNNKKTFLLPFQLTDSCLF